MVRCACVWTPKASSRPSRASYVENSSLTFGDLARVGGTLKSVTPATMEFGVVVEKNPGT